MEIIYTNHAEEKLAERKISKREIEKSLKNPDAVLDGRDDVKIVHKLIRDKLLRIAYKSEKDFLLVITAYYTHPERYEE
ncbi:MAG TPA: DUF4258 domain-containing protein [Candidatus Methanoperedens sp.]|nr:DUF4258 domain-containing protein [Candidatus Methanoperedens sp.]